MGNETFYWDGLWPNWKSLYSGNILTHVEKIPAPKQGLNHAPLYSFDQIEDCFITPIMFLHARIISASKHGVNLAL